jgi:hypothetical protein
MGEKIEVIVAAKFILGDEIVWGAPQKSFRGWYLEDTAADSLVMQLARGWHLLRSCRY